MTTRRKYASQSEQASRSAQIQPLIRANEIHQHRPATNTRRRKTMRLRKATMHGNYRGARHFLNRHDKKRARRRAF
ncbi:hypothetical protein [Blackfly microvirus SF02]|uniref:Uncharacterized protein n=1 Tax=Blackfly microvirus SF02 TaxID=2576452 RepID=A0A4P8PLX3_9VIRU|nr:hypothetical protein [Blackfly microvirus SF02]